MSETAPLNVVSILTTHVAGGAEFATVDLLDALAYRGARIRLLTNRPDLADGTNVVTVPIALGPKLRRRTAATVTLQAPLTLARMIEALRREARAAPIDVLLLHYKKEQLLSALIPRSLARAVVWAEWGPLPLAMRGRAPHGLYRFAARRAAALIAESEATAQSLRAAGVPLAKIVVVPNVLDPDQVEFDPKARRSYRRAWGLEEAFVLGCISRLDHDKRLEVLIGAMEHLDHDVALVIAGEGADESTLRRHAARLGRRVVFAGSARGRVAQILSSCDVQVYAPGPTEGAARAITLGQLTGRPVIATAPEGARDLIVPGTGSIVSPAHDPLALARCVETYRSDPRRLAAEGVAARLHALDRIEAAQPLATLEATLRAVSGGPQGASPRSAM